MWGRAADFVGHFSWAYLPIGLFALIAVGIHAGADAIDDRVLWGVDRLDALWDAFFSQWTFTEPLVDWLGLEGRSRFARGVAFCWELGGDLVLAVPALAYGDEPVPTRSFRSWLRRPSVARLVYPVATVALVLAGAASISQMVQVALFHSLSQGVVGPSAGLVVARAVSLAMLFVILTTMGWRALVGSLLRAEALERRRQDRFWRALTVGSWGALVVVPLALAALLEATFWGALWR